MVDECSVNTAKKKHLVVCTAQNWRENRQLDKNLADNWRSNVLINTMLNQIKQTPEKRCFIHLKARVQKVGSDVFDFS
jgi:hypothetical protein